MTRRELTALINLAWDATEHSKAGPIASKDATGGTLIHNPGYSVFLTLLGAIVPRSQSVEVRDPPEDWQGGEGA